MNNEEVRLECSPKLVKGHSEINCAHPPLMLVYVKTWCGSASAGKLIPHTVTTTIILRLILFLM